MNRQLQAPGLKLLKELPCMHFCFLPQLLQELHCDCQSYSKLEWLGMALRKMRHKSQVHKVHMLQGYNEKQGVVSRQCMKSVHYILQQLTE